jgi:hypothetical protein
MKTKHLSSKFLKVGTLLASVIMLLGCAHNVGAQPWLASPSPSPNNIYYNAGNVGIGTDVPSTVSGLDLSSYKILHVLSSGSTGTRLVATGGSSASVDLIHSGASANQKWFNIATLSGKGYIRSLTDSGSVNYNFFVADLSNGNVGIGTDVPSTVSGLDLSSYKILHVLSSGSTGTRLVATGGSGASVDLIHSGASANQKWFNIATLSGKGYIRSLTDSGSVNYNFFVADLSNGNVGIGTTSPGYKLDVNGDTRITGDINVTGNIKAKFQDLAEWVPSSERLAAGTVVILDSAKSNQVISSTQSYDTLVAGVVSAQPGIALGESGENKVLVATTGRVMVKADARRGAIHIGDLLVTSDVAGTAMKSEPVNLGGVQFHRPGTLIGKALEPLEKGSGKILVLLSLQ